MARNLLSKLEDNTTTFLPSNIAKYTFTHAAMDNIDINETQSGQGAIHV